MSKPSTAPIRFIRKPKLKTEELSILALENKGKITGFTVKFKDNAKTFPVVNNKVERAFKDAEKYAAKLITQTSNAERSKPIKAEPKEVRRKFSRT